jgi:uncharacterized integral membrane protein
MLDYIIQNCTDTEIAALCGLVSIPLGLIAILILSKILP